jgi:hypothetical protein
MHRGRARTAVSRPLDGDLSKDRLRMAGIQALVGMPRPLTRAVSGPYLDRWADIAGPPLGDMGLQQQPLDLAPTAFLLPLDGMQGQLTALLTHEPGLQGLKRLPGLDQMPHSGQPRDGWQWDSEGRTHDRLLLARDPPMNDALSKLAIEEPAAVALFHPQFRKINRL